MHSPSSCLHHHDLPPNLPSTRQWRYGDVSLGKGHSFQRARDEAPSQQPAAEAAFAGCSLRLGRAHTQPRASRALAGQSREQCPQRSTSAAARPLRTDGPRRGGRLRDGRQGLATLRSERPKRLWRVPEGRGRMRALLRGAMPSMSLRLHLGKRARLLVVPLMRVGSSRHRAEMAAA